MKMTTPWLLWGLIISLLIPACKYSGASTFLTQNGKDYFFEKTATFGIRVKFPEALFQNEKKSDQNYAFGAHCSKLDLFNYSRQTPENPKLDQFDYIANGMTLIASSSDQAFRHDEHNPNEFGLLKCYSIDSTVTEATLHLAFHWQGQAYKKEIHLTRKVNQHLID